MTLKEVGLVIGKKLERRHTTTEPFKVLIIVSFEGTEIRHGRLLISSYGKGKTVGKAKADYCKQLKGQILVMDAMSKTRKEIQLPPKITVK